MKIGINARFISQPYTGIGQYTVNLFKKLAGISKGDEFVLVSNQKTEEKFPLNITVKIIPEKKWLISASLKKLYWEQVQVPRFFTKNNFDILHFTYPAYPLKGLKTQSFITIHDLIQFADPQYLKKLRSRVYAWITKKCLTRASKNQKVKFVAVSDTTKSEFEKFFTIDRKKIQTIYEGASEEFLRPVTAKTNMKKPYLLYVGGYDPRKNIGYLLEVFEGVQKEIPEMNLVLAGGQALKSDFYGSYDLQNGTKGYTLNTLKTGFVSEEELNSLYKEAEAFINLSGGEGFNLPVLQSAYAGTPIIISDIPVHRELYSNHALLIPTNDAKNASGEIVAFMQNENLKEKLRKETTMLRAKYTWDKAAKKYYQLYLTTL